MFRCVSEYFHSLLLVSGGRGVVSYPFHVVMSRPLMRVRGVIWYTINYILCLALCQPCPWYAVICVSTVLAVGLAAADASVVRYPICRIDYGIYYEILSFWVFKVVHITSLLADCWFHWCAPYKQIFIS